MADLSVIDRFDQDVDAPGAALPAQRVADHPAHRISSRDVDELFAGLQYNGRYLLGARIEPVERAVSPGIHLNGVDVAGAGRFDTRGLVGFGDRLLWRDFFFPMVAIGICRDFCERIDPNPNPFAALDADLFLIPSMGNKTTMRGHLETAREIALKYRASAFVAQQSESKRPAGYLIFPEQNLDQATSAFEIDMNWTTCEVDSKL